MGKGGLEREEKQTPPTSFIKPHLSLLLPDKAHATPTEHCVFLLSKHTYIMYDIHNCNWKRKQWLKLIQISKLQKFAFEKEEIHPNSSGEKYRKMSHFSMTHLLRMFNLLDSVHLISAVAKSTLKNGPNKKMSYELLVNTVIFLLKKRTKNQKTLIPWVL